MIPHADNYARMLGGLEGDAFEAEVCARLGTCIADFQRIPRRPAGDAGLDGLSHGQTRAYCCYGPEQEPFKKSTKGLKDDILEKFRGDLRKLFELTYETKRKLVEKPSAEMKTILAPGRKIKNVYLVVSWFETHRIIGPLNQSFAEYKAASSRTYIADDAQPTIWGPKDLATLWAVDEHALFRIEQFALLAKVRQAVASGVKPSTLGDFDAKFDYLRQKTSSGRRAAVDRLADHFREAWSTAIALESELAATSMTLHEALEQARTQAAVSADLRSAQSASPQGLIDDMRNEVRGHLGDAFGERLGPLAPHVADGEIARLIGECPIDWRK
jgi:hypothetical protein